MSMIFNVVSLPESRLAELYASPDDVIDFIEAAYNGEKGLGEVVDTDKAWAGIHYMLTGSEWEGELPLAFITLGGTPVGDVDVGYGPARGMSAADVKTLAAALHDITPGVLKRRFDPKAMTKQSIYPNIWDEGDEAFDYCATHFESLKQAIADAAAKGHAMLIWMN